MRVLVTGATGFLGNYIVKRLAAEGVDMVTIVRRTSRTEHLAPYKIEIIEGNIRDMDSLKQAMKGVDVVIHASVAGGSWEDFYAENVESTERLLELSKAAGVKRFVFISSVDVYSFSKVKHGSVLKEDFTQETDPPNFYSRAKIEAEAVVNRYHQEHGVPTVIIRPACIYGVRGFWYPSRLGFSLGSGAYALFGNGKSLVPLSYAENVADLIWRSIQDDRAVGQSYNHMEDEKVTRLEFLQAAKEFAFPDMKIAIVPLFFARFLAWSLRTALKMAGMTPPTRLAPLVLRQFAMTLEYDNQKAKDELDWKPTPNVWETIEETLRWFGEQRTQPRFETLIVPTPVRIESKNRIRAGIVGCGGFANLHLTVLSKMKNAEVAALCDPAVDSARALADKYKVPKVYASMDEMLAAEKLDVVHIVSPVRTHAELSIQAMEAGCHVLVEKPVAMNAEEAEAMDRAAKECNVKLCAEHTMLYNDASIEARDLIQKGGLGDILQLEGWFGTSYSSNLGSPYLRWDAKDHWIYDMPGMIFQDFMPHPLSMMLDIMGPVDEIAVASRYNKFVPHLKSDELRITLGNDRMLATLSLSLGVTPRHNFVNVYGTKSTLKLDYMTGTALSYADIGPIPKGISRNLVARRHGRQMRKAGRKNIVETLSGKIAYSVGYLTLFQLFYKSILEDSPVPVPFENALEVMRVMDRIWPKLELK